MKLVKYLCLVFFVGAGVSAYSQTVWSGNIVGYINQLMYAGDNLIANQLSTSNNTLNAIFQPGVPEGATFAEWNPLTHQYLPTSVFDINTGWSINYELDFGQGGLLHTSANFTNTFVGSVWPGYDGVDPFVPPLITETGTLLLSCYVPFSAATFHDVVGRDPLNGELVTRLDPATQISTTTVFENGVWNNGAPTQNVGESAFFTLVPEPAVYSLMGVGLLLLTTGRKTRTRLKAKR